ncbi:hypothetical protein ASPCAL10483 [Aspergillus calidoustus]|uniref:Integral membrane protein n=1 Tax=Aspergillus calidoustus TaxID=454130 RepID=A0A0U5G6X1_ASPCI|nr:hypothetical protein ASPCAL10483 [Aspergillus calidoustus]
MVVTLELILVLISLSLSLHAYPDTCRTILWQYGGTEGWNSDPHARIYFYANYREPPPIPKIWSDEITESNLAISAISSVAWIVRLVLRRCRPSGSTRYNNILLLFDAALIACWALSIGNQISGDFSDEAHPSEWPWYLVYRCDGLERPEYGCCVLARVLLWFSGNLLMLYSGRFLWGLYELYRSAVGRNARQR